MNVHPLAVAAYTAAALLLVVMPSPAGHAPPSKPLLGVLYARSAHPTTAALAPPSLAVGVEPEARRLLPSGGDVTVHFVPVEASTFTLTLQPRWQALQHAAERARRPAPRRVQAPKPAPPPAAPLPPPQAPKLAPAAPAPTLPATFTEIDEALRASPTTKAVNVRLKNGGVSFRLTNVGRVRDQWVVRYAVANEEAADFFLSIVNVTAGGKPLRAETAGPYACRAGQEIFGVVHFAATGVAGKPVALELVQSGGDHRRFPLTVPYGF